MKPTTVTVHWSESRLFPEREAQYEFSQFEQLALQAANEHPSSGGYFKTQVTVHFDDGRSHQCRLDLAPHDTLGFADHVQKTLRYVAAQGEAFREKNKRLIEFFQEIEWPMRKISITYGALTRVEYVHETEVPADATDAEIREMADEIYEEQLDGSEFKEDKTFWERGETTWKWEH